MSCQSLTSAFPLAAAAAAAVPIALSADIDMHGPGVAIGANAAATGQRSQVARKRSLADTLELNVSRHASNVH